MAVKPKGAPAARKKRSASTSGPRRPAGRNRQVAAVKPEKKNAHLVYEIVAMSCLVLAFLLILGIYFESAGIVGKLLRQTLFGMFGVGAYLLPAYAFVGSLFKIFNHKNQKLNNKLALLFFLIVSIATLTHLLYLDKAQINSKMFGRSTLFPALINYYSVSLEEQQVGGFVGGLLGDLFALLLGKVGGILVVVLINLSILILLTEQSLFKLVHWISAGAHKRSNAVYEKSKAAFAQHQEQSALRRAEREAELAAKREAQEETDQDPFIKQIEEHEKRDQLRVQMQKAAGWFGKNKNQVGGSGSKALDDLSEAEEFEEEEGLIGTEGEPKAATADEMFASSHAQPMQPSADENAEAVRTLEAEVMETERMEAVTQEEETAVDEGEALMAQPVESDIPMTSQPAKPIQISFFKESPKPKMESEGLKDAAVKIHTVDETLNKTLYEYPPLQLLKENPVSGVKGSTLEIEQNALKLEQTLDSFGVKAKVVNVSYGPTVTRYELQPEVGVKVSRIVSLSDDIALNLAASGIRMEAPIPGKALIGIEVPNKEVSSVYIKEVIDTPQFQKFPSKIAFALGKDISGETIIADIAKMPHMLISGSTGSGKSVCINTLITSILYRANPNEVKLLMIDPKVVELKVYNGIPHLLIPVVTDPKKAAGALYWAVQEMSERYQLFANANVRDLAGYNRMAEESGELKKLPQIVIIVDELADLMQVAAKDVEEAICRLAQMARAAGIHLILATQRPSVDVITGIIKANVPSRIAFMVSSGIDSRTIIDMNGAEKLVGKGDMLYYPVGMPKPLRVQGAFISDREVESIVEFLKASQKVHYDQTILDKISKDAKGKEEAADGDDSEVDSLFEDALSMVIDMQKASASMIQRRFRVGYNRAARMIDQLHEAGFIGPDEGSKPRRVLLTKAEFDTMKYEAKDGSTAQPQEEVLAQE